MSFYPMSILCHHSIALLFPSLIFRDFVLKEMTKQHFGCDHLGEMKDSIECNEFYHDLHEKRTFEFSVV
jgi:hypothetical protein